VAKCRGCLFLRARRGPPGSVAGAVKIVQNFARVGVIDDGFDWHRQLDRFPFLTGPIAALSVPAPLGGVLGLNRK